MPWFQAESMRVVALDWALAYGAYQARVWTMEQVIIKSDGGSIVAPCPQPGKRISARSQYHRVLGPEFQRRGSSGKPDCRWGNEAAAPSFVLDHHGELGKALLIGHLEAQSFKSNIQHPHQLWTLGPLKSSKLVNLMERS